MYKSVDTSPSTPQVVRTPVALSQYTSGSDWSRRRATTPDIIAEIMVRKRYPYPPHEWSFEILRGWTQARLEFPKRWGRREMGHGVWGVWIFSETKNSYLEKYVYRNTNKNTISLTKMLSAEYILI